MIHCNHIFYQGKQRSQERSKSRKISKNYGENRNRTNSRRKISIWKNPVLEGLGYLKLYHSGHYPTYEIIAKKHDVTRARICQMIALAKKLPKETCNFLRFQILARYSNLNLKAEIFSQNIIRRFLVLIFLFTINDQKRH